MAKFSDPNDVRSVIEYIRQTDITFRSFNRSRIDQLFNGEPTYTDQECDENNIENNGNFLEAASVAHKARTTWNNAHLANPNFFTIKVDSGPKHKRTEVGMKLTNRVNRIMKANLRYMESIRATGAQVVLHGIGPVWWPNSKAWKPVECGIEDLMIPSGTYVNMENLSHFAIWTKYTAGEVYRMTHGRKVDPGWRMPVVRAALKKVAKDLLAPQDSYQDLMNPEKIAEFYKANGGFLDTDAVPTINVWQFFYQEDNGQWFRKMLLDDSTFGSDDNAQGEFLYDPKRPYAGNLSQILHVQFGDGANVAPFRYHSVRSLGFLLFFVCHLQNRLRIRFTDAIFEATLQYFRVTNADDRSRLGAINLTHLGLIPEGLELIPREQRWEINENLVVAGLSQNRQLIQENAASYVQDQDTGTGKELTATEVMARLNSANALVSSLLAMSYTYQEFQYREIARRFCIRNSKDPDVRKFRRQCLEDGIPEEMIDSERWEIQPDKVMGGGNKTLQITQAKALMEVKPQYDPEQQREILRDYTIAVTDDPDKALRLVPDKQRSVSNSAHDAQLAVGALMNGAPVDVVQGIDHIDYVASMLKSMQFIIEDIEHLGSNATPMQVLGLTNCYKHTQAHIQILAQDPENKQLVKQAMDQLGKLANYIKAYGQRIDEAQAAQQNQPDPVDTAKAAAITQTAQTKNRLATFTAGQNEQRKNIGFRNDQARKDASLRHDLRRKTVETGADIAALGAKTKAAVEAKKASVKTFAE